MRFAGTTGERPDRSRQILWADTSFVNLADLKSGSADAIRSSFEGIVISVDDLGKRIVGFGAGGDRLELSIKDVLKGTPFVDIEEMLLDVYYMYKNSCKRLRELKGIHDEYEGSLKPKRASGMRWISHKLAAMKVLLDKYRIFIQHLEQMSEKRSYNLKIVPSSTVGYVNGLMQDTHS